MWAPIASMVSQLHDIYSVSMNGLCEATDYGPLSPYHRGVTTSSPLTILLVVTGSSQNKGPTLHISAMILFLTLLPPISSTFLFFHLF